MTPSKMLTALALTAALTAGTLVITSPAEAASSPRPNISVTADRHEARMGRYAAADFTAQAKRLPAELVHAVNGQLRLGAAAYLARAAAGAQAGVVLDGLAAAGVRVTGSRLDGTTLDVYVGTAADAARVAAVGAHPIVGEPPAAPKTVRVDALSGVASTSPVNGGSQLQGGDVWGYDSTDSFWVYCSVGFNGYDKTTGASEFLTAGHCDSPSNPDYHPAATNAWAWFDTQATTTTAVSNNELNAPEDTSKSLGTLSTSNFHYGSGDDYGIVPLSAGATTPAAAVTTWGGSSTTASSAGVQNTGTSVAMKGVAAPVTGMPVCHSGGSTGFLCGTLDNDGVDAIVGNQMVSGFTTTICTVAGDSGGSFISGNYAVGILSGGGDCSPGHVASVAFGLLSPAPYSSVYNDSNFEVAVQVPTPQVTTANAVKLAGILPAGAVGTKVTVSIDGGAPVSTTSTTDANGVDQDWSFQLHGLTAGTHSYSVQASYGTRSVSSTTSSSFTAQVITPGAVAITGTLAAGQQLTAAPSGFSAEDAISYSYAWDINGMRSPSTLPTITAAEDVEQDDVYEVTVTASAPNMEPVVVTSAAVTVPRFVRTFDPFTPVLSWSESPVTGVATVTAGELPAAVTPVTASYAWWVDGMLQPGQDTAQLVVTSRSSAHTITAQVTVTAPTYQSAQATSAALQIPAWVSANKPPTQTPPPPVVTLPRIAPKILGTAKVGSKLSIRFPKAYPAGTTKRFQWYAAGKPIKAATKSTLVVPAAAAGKKIVVKVAASLGGQVQSVPSLQTKAVAKGALRVGGAKITGTRATGRTLAIHRTGKWTGGVKVKIQWLASGHPIKGATKSKLKLSPAFAHRKITVKLTASKTGYATVTKTAK